jgi:hypothetical protein
MTGTGPEPDPSADEPASEELQHDFRSIITLLSLVTDFNNRGRPILLHDGQLIYRSPLDPKAQPTSTISLNALAAIFVRNAEVTAITPAAYPGMASQAPADASDKLNIGVVASEQQWPTTDDDPDDPDFQQLAFTDGVRGFAAVANPLRGEVFFNKSLSKSHCKIIDSGDSHLRHFVDEDVGDQFAHNTWRYCLSIE